MVPAAAARRVLPALLTLALVAPAAATATPTLEAQELAKIGFASRAGGTLRPALLPSDPLFQLTSYRWVFERPRAVRASDSRFGRLDVAEALAVLAGVPSPHALAPPTVVGTAAAGATLRATAGAWTNATTFAYQWLRCKASACAALPEATRPTYTVVAADQGHRLAVQVAATKAGERTVARSAATAIRRFTSSRG
jgi:hypothetical protein